MFSAHRTDRFSYSRQNNAIVVIDNKSIARVPDTDLNRKTDRYTGGHTETYTAEH